MVTGINIFRALDIPCQIVFQAAHSNLASHLELPPHCTLSTLACFRVPLLFLYFYYEKMDIHKNEKIGNGKTVYENSKREKCVMANKVRVSTVCGLGS